MVSKQYYFVPLFTILFLLDHKLIFPPTHQAHDDGLLCIGGDLSVERLLLAYQQGIFPWYNEGEPICWYSPDPRFVLFPDQLYVSKSMEKIIRQNNFTWSLNQHTNEVIKRCRYQNRPGQDGTWLTDEMEAAYNRLHQAGYIISAECFMNDQLVGGLYGVLMNQVFCGESMFSEQSNASKFAFIQLVRYLQQQGIKLIDCQVYTPHLESLGAEMISRSRFESFLT